MDGVVEVVAPLVLDEVDQVDDPLVPLGRGTASSSRVNQSPAATTATTPT